MALPTRVGGHLGEPVTEFGGPGRVGCLVGPPRREEVPGLVGQEEVAEVERRAVAGHRLAAEGPEAGRRLGVGGVAVDDEADRRLVGPWLGHTPEDGDALVEQGAHDARRRRPSPLLTDARRADLGQGLHSVDVVGAAQEGEDVLLEVRGHGGGEQLLGQLTGEDGRQGRGRERRHPGVVAEPGRVPGQVGEPGVGVGVDAPLAVQQRDLGELVEGDEHDRDRVADLDLGGVDAVGHDQVGHRRGQEEEGEERGRGQGEVPQDRPGLLGSEEQPAGRDGDDQAREDQPGTALSVQDRRLDDLDGEQADAETDDGDVDPVPDRRPEETERLLDQPQHERRPEHHEQGVEDDLGRARGQRHQLFGRLLDDVEDRLGHGHRR